MACKPRCMKHGVLGVMSCDEPTEQCCPLGPMSKTKHTHMIYSLVHALTNRYHVVVQSTPHMPILRRSCMTGKQKSMPISNGLN